MPACSWAGTGQKNVYLPGLRVTVTVEVPPLFTVAPTLSTPPPLTPTPCAIGDGFAMVIVTEPAFAESVFVLKASWPLGSAEIFRFAPAPLLAGVLELAAGVLVAGADVELALEELLLPPPPHPASAMAAVAAPKTSNVGMRITVVPPDRVTVKTRPPLGFFPGGQPESGTPLRSSQSAAWVRSVTPSCANTWVRCALTVFSLISRRRAMSLFGRPWPTSSSTSRSRGDSSTAGR